MNPLAARAAAAAPPRAPIALLLLCVLVAPLAHAAPLDGVQNSPSPQSCAAPPGGPPALCAGPASQPTGAGPDLGAGNPINVLSGNKYQREVDMPALPGVLGLELVRHYNSAHAGPQTMNRILGRGWFLS
jgi:hypothetical protein